GPLRYNIVGEEASNLDVALRMAAAAGRSLDYELVDYHSQRPGHDHRYALDGSKLADLGWPGPRPLDDTLADIAAWYAANPQWLDIDTPKAAAHAARRADRRAPPHPPRRHPVPPPRPRQPRARQPPS